MRIWLIVGLLLGQIAALGQEADEPDQQPQQSYRDRMRALREKALRLIRATEELGNWDEHYEYMLDATERVFERNNWNSESDLFSLEMVREVGQIPPWNTWARLDKALEMVGDRYLLDEGQMASLQGHAIKLNVDLFTRHSDRIMQYAVEAVQTRAAGEPFTPEQVARWTKLAEPVFEDARKSVNAMAEDFMEELDPEQRELVQRDLGAANRRMSDIERLGQKWKRGEWDPHDWGMEDDPIQNRWARGPESPATGEAEAPPESPPARAAPQPAGVAEANARPRERAAPVQAPKADDPWAKYVRAFIRKYHLNDEQQQRAWLVYRDTKERDKVFERRHERRIKALRAKAGDSNDDRSQAVLREQNEKRRSESERLFSLLKRRLERLPTRAQRKNAEPGDINAPDSSPNKTSGPKKKP
ncbi:MAG: hypothetical protein ACE5I3_14135 [Phycisphaerae bacterium]